MFVQILLSDFPAYPRGPLHWVLFSCGAAGASPLFYDPRSWYALKSCHEALLGRLTFQKLKSLWISSHKKVFALERQTCMEQWSSWLVTTYVQEMAWWRCCCGLTEQKIKNLPHEVTWQLFNQSLGHPSLEEPINVLEKTTHAKLDWKEEEDQLATFLLALIIIFNLL